MPRSSQKRDRASPMHEGSALTRLRARLFDPAEGEIRREHLLLRRLAETRSSRALLRARRDLALAALVIRCAREAVRVLPADLALRLAVPRRSMLVHHLRQGWRQMARRPAASAAVIGILAVGIGGNAAIFAIVRNVVLVPLPYPGSERLVAVTETFKGRPASLSVLNYEDFRDQARTLRDMAAWYDIDTTLTDGRPERVVAHRVSANLFEVLGVSPGVGRSFVGSDDRSGGEAVAVLGAALATRRFGSPAAAVGEALEVDGTPTLVIGVMPTGFAYPSGAELWLPLALTPSQLEPKQRGAHYLRAVARLEGDASLEEARADVSRIAKLLALEHPRSNELYGANVESLLDHTVGSTRAGLLWLSAAIGLVLLIACADVASLQLARAAERDAEIALRAALGASSRRLFEQLIGEGLVLAGTALVAGLALASAVIAALPSWLPAGLPRAASIQLDGWVVGFAALVSVVAAVVFGLAPAVHAARADPIAALVGGRGSQGTRVSRWFGPLVVLETALALVLLAGAGLALRSLNNLASVDPGFAAGDAISFEVALPPALYPAPEDVSLFTARLVERIAAEPGIASAAAASIPPLSPSRYHSTFGIDGRPKPSAEDEPRAAIRAVTPGYFETLRIPLVEGRAFERGDSLEGLQVAIVSRAAARAYWPGESPLGQRIRVHAGVSRRDPQRVVVGVAGDVRLRALDEAPRPTIYLPHAQYEWNAVTALAAPEPGHRLDPSRLPAVLADIDARLAAHDVRFVEQLVDDVLGAPRFRTGLLTAFGAMALALAALGLYGVTSFAVGLRTREMGVRMALGAPAHQVVALVLRRALVPVVLGVAIGGAATAGLGELVRKLLHGVEPLDPATFGAVVAALLLAALGAALVPALRVARIDPVVSLHVD